jgi:apoptosis-inducing factor 2
MTMAKIIVVLGAGLAGIPITHFLLDLSRRQQFELKVILVSPNEDFYVSSFDTGQVIRIES